MCVSVCYQAPSLWLGPKSAVVHRVLQHKCVGHVLLCGSRCLEWLMSLDDRAGVPHCEQALFLLSPVGISVRAGDGGADSLHLKYCIVFP